MSDSNPYQSPSTPASPFEGHTEVDTMLYEATQSLAQTKPWVRFLSVLGFIGSAGMVVVVVGMMAFRRGPFGPGLIEMIVMVLMFVLFYFIPSFLLWNYASRIGEFLKASNPLTFSAAIAAQKSFWKYLGILTLVIMCFYAVMLVFGSMAWFLLGA